MVDEICVPKHENETVIELVRGPVWGSFQSRWEWTFVMYRWDMSPAMCGKCGRCTNPDNVTPCGHPEAKKCVRGQVFVSDMVATEKRLLEIGRTVRYVRDGRVISGTEAKRHNDTKTISR